MNSTLLIKLKKCRNNTDIYAHNTNFQEVDESKLLKISNDSTLINKDQNQIEEKPSSIVDEDYFELECHNEQFDFEVVQAQPSENNCDDIIQQESIKVTENELYDVDKEAEYSHLNTYLISEGEEDDNELLNVSDSVIQNDKQLSNQNDVDNKEIYDNEYDNLNDKEEYNNIKKILDFEDNLNDQDNQNKMMHINS